MKRLLLLLSLVPSMALASSAFDGTWKTKPGSVQVSGTPNAYELSNGMFHCRSCVPQINVKADGQDQRVAGHDYYDSIAIKIVNNNAVEITRQQGGKLISTDAATVSADGHTLTEKWVDYTGAKPASATSTSQRLTAGPAGSHALSGTWKQDKTSDESDSVVTVKYQSTADGLKMEWNGQSYDAKFDGKEYLTMNDPGKTMVSLKRIDATTIEETDRRAGNVTDVIRTTVSGDAKSLSVVDVDPVRNTRMTYTMIKQP
jgi:hypothetical protein